MKPCLEDDEIERQQKCKIYDVELCFLGCFKEYHTKARFSAGCGGWSLYIHQGDNKKCIHIEFYYKTKTKLNSVAFNPQANYTDQATAACRRS
jgi:hypothetical protein